MCDLTVKGISEAREKVALTLAYMPQKGLTGKITVIFPVTIIQQLESTFAGSDKQAQFQEEDERWCWSQGFWLGRSRTRHIQPCPRRLNYLLENADCFTLSWIADQSVLFSVKMPRCTAWANSFLFMQDQMGRVSLLIKRSGWGCSGSLAEVGMAPSLRLDPCGAGFTHLQSLTPHAAEANGQNCWAAESKDSKLLLIIWLTIKTFCLADKDGTFLATRQSKRVPTTKM